MVQNKGLRVLVICLLFIIIIFTLLSLSQSHFFGLVSNEPDWWKWKLYTGVPGKIGEKGAQGDPGEKGDKGDPGEQGFKGDTGPKGDEGPQGDRGMQGILSSNIWWHVLTKKKFQRWLIFKKRLFYFSLFCRHSSVEKLFWKICITFA